MWKIWELGAHADGWHEGGGHLKEGVAGRRGGAGGAGGDCTP